MKKLVIGLSMLLACQLVVGCGNGDIGGKTTSEAVKQNDTPKASQEVKSQDVKKGTFGLDASKIEMKGTIKVSTYEDDNYMVAAAKAFEAKYPDVKVDVDVFAPLNIEISADGKGMSSTSNDDPNLSLDKYVTQLNAAFMNGSASDLINLRGLPFYKYISSGYLYDLKETVEGSDGLNSEGYYMNVLDAMKYDEGYYHMPFLFNAYAMGVVRSYVEGSGMTLKDLSNENWSLSNMSDLAKKIKEKTGKVYPIYHGSPQGVVFRQLAIGENKFIDLKNKEVAFDSNAFITLIKQIKDLSDEGYVNPENGYSLFASNNEIWAPYCNEDFYTTDYEDNFGAWKAFTNEEGEEAMLPFCDYGLNAKSDHKELCWAFMKFMYSEEMQSDASAYGRRMNKAADRKAVEKMIDYDMKDGPIHYTVSKAKVLEDSLAQYDNWSSKIKSYQPIDMIMMDTIANELTPYFKGEKTAEEVAKIIQNKVGTMLKE